MAVINLQEYVSKRLGIITPVYLPDKHLWNVCVNSVLEQTTDQWKWYVGFDGDKSYKRAMARSERWDELVNHPNVIIEVFKKHRGVSYVRNRLIEKANTGWVGFLDADNWLYDDYVSIVRQAINQTDMTPLPGELVAKKLLIFGQSMRVQTPQLEKTKLYGFNWRIPHRVPFEILIQGNRIDLGQIVHNLEGEGRPKFPEDMDRLVDWDYILQLVDRGYEQIPLEQFITFYDHVKRTHRINSSKDYARNHCKLLRHWRKRITAMLEQHGQDADAWFERLPY